MSAPAIMHTDEELDGMLADAARARRLWQRWFYPNKDSHIARDNAADMAPRLAANIENLVAELRHARAASSSSTPLSEPTSEGT